MVDYLFARVRGDRHMNKNDYNESAINASDLTRWRGFDRRWDPKSANEVEELLRDYFHVGERKNPSHMRTLCRACVFKGED